MASGFSRTVAGLKTLLAPWHATGHTAGKATLPPITRGDRRHDAIFVVSALAPARAWLSWYESSKEEEPFVRAYLAGTTLVDARFGRVLSALRGAGLDGNAIVG